MAYIYLRGILFEMLQMAPDIFFFFFNFFTLIYCHLFGVCSVLTFDWQDNQCWLVIGCVWAALNIDIPKNTPTFTLPYTHLVFLSLLFEKRYTNYNLIILLTPSCFFFFAKVYFKNSHRQHMRNEYSCLYLLALVSFQFFNRILLFLRKICIIFIHINRPHLF